MGEIFLKVLSEWVNYNLEKKKLYLMNWRYNSLLNNLKVLKWNKLFLIGYWNTEEDVEETMDINKTCTFNINNERTNHELTLDLKMKCNNITNEKELHITMRVDNEFQNKRSSCSLKPLIGQLRLSADLKKWKWGYRGLQEQAKKMKVMTTIYFWKQLSGKIQELKYEILTKHKKIHDYDIRYDRRTL